MRMSPLALTGPLLLALGAVAVPAQPPPAAPAGAAGGATVVRPAGPRVEFENGAMPAVEKELLTRYATTVTRWAMVQRIVQAVQAQDAKAMPPERIQQIDLAWQRGEDPEGLATALAKNDCAQVLQTLLSSNPGYGDAFVADDRGALVCMSERTSGYWHGDEAKWSRAYAEGAGAIFVSQGEHDESTGLDLVRISVPVRAAGRVIGVLIVGRIVSPR
ncbi:MAG TPA: hypothetical protein VGV61_11355 [Thermoanaerobaculia bacterium]|jgi:hypothetical protein|nr:hypothetical protein [Thermoanaerobaculia bacterium]